MINFLKYKWFYFGLSAFLIAIGIVSMVRYGFVYSIDFKGGTNLEYKFEKDLGKRDIQKVFERAKSKIMNIERTAAAVYLIQMSPIDGKTEELVRKELKEISKGGVERLRFETVGPSLGTETIRKTAVATAVAVVGILLYMTFAFSQSTYGLAAILAMIHDLLILIGMYSLLTVLTPAEVDGLFVTAVLTTMSFSVHDTIVVFDKIREHQKNSSLPMTIMANKALTETMVRSINNSVTIILMLIPLVVLGSVTIRFFAAALLIGTIAGTYSSPFIATPLLVLFHRKKQ